MRPAGRTCRSGTIDASAANWLARLDASDSGQLREEFQKWLDADPLHRVAFIRLRVAWNRSDMLKLLRPADGSVDEDLMMWVKLY